MLQLNRSMSQHAIEEGGALLQDDEKILVLTGSRNNRRLSSFAGLFLILTVGVIYLVIKISDDKSFPSKWLSCGENVTTALERGCKFDAMSFAWQTPECYDSDLVSEFLDWADWVWYTDFNYNETVPKNEALQGQQTLTVSWEYHLTHCTFLWRQMHRAYERGWIDTHLRAYDHTLHCQQVILFSREVPERSLHTIARVIFPTCDEVGSKDGGWRNDIFNYRQTLHGHEAGGHAAA